MREFNAEERKIIDFLNNIFNKSKLPIAFEAIIMSFCLNNKNLVIDFDKKTALLKIDMDFYKQGGSTIAVEEVRNFNKTIITTINIIKTLQDNGLVVAYLETQQVTSGKQEYGNLIHNPDGKEKDSFIAQIHDKYTIQSLIEFSRKSIWGGEQLSKFVGRGFKTHEEKVRQIELLVAVFALVITTVIGIFDLFHSSHIVYLLEKIHHIIKCCY